MTYRLGVLGATGRMGMALKSVLSSDSSFGDFELVYEGSTKNDRNFEKLASERVDVVIDFSTPDGSLKAALVCAKNKIPLLVCTTGFRDGQFESLSKTLEDCAWIYAPNTSLGVFALTEGLKAMMKVLPSTYKIEIIESHHEQKKDAPSGTAKMLASVLSDLGAQEIPIHSLRGGSDPGEHTVVVMGPGERLEFTHRSEGRALFSVGALQLARRLPQLKARKTAYSVGDVFPLMKK